MSELLCTPTPITTKEGILELLRDKGGAQYYSQMKEMKVDQEALARLNLRPVFVGVDRDLIRAAIDGEAETIRGRLAEKVSPDEFARPDRAGGWIIPLGTERRIVGGA